MIKTIFVPMSGTDTDEGVLATALALARPLNAHLDCFHVRLSTLEAAVRSPHVQFCVGAALGGALKQLQEHDERLAISAIGNFERFCGDNQIPMRTAAIGIEGVSAQFLEETDDAQERLLFHARHRDLTVLGRTRHRDLMPPNLIELMMMGGGRPIVIAPDAPRANAKGTIVVGWKETAEAARALGAAMPLLQQARRVLLLGVAEGSSRPEAQGHLALRHLTQQLRWHNVIAESHFLDHQSEAAPTPERIVEFAFQNGADLLVIGGYGHGPLRETVFGGVTKTLIDAAPVPLLLMH